MNFINRAIKNVIRRKSKSMLLIMTFFLIGNLVIIGLGISTASESAKVLTRQKMRAVVTYGLDYDAVYNYADTIEDEDERNDFYGKNFPKVTLGDVETILGDSRVKTANALSSNQLYSGSDDFTFVHLGNSAEDSYAEAQESCYLDENGNKRCDSYISPEFFVKANYFPNMIEFVDGDFTIVDGRFYSQQEIDNSEMVVVISENLAEYNGLSVGDTIKLYVTSPSYLNNEEMGIDEDDILMELEIVGIYAHNNIITPDSENYDYTSPYENQDNVLLMPGTTLYNCLANVRQKEFDYNAMKYPDQEYYQNDDNRPSTDDVKEIEVYDTTILLNDPLVVDEFIEEYSGSLRQFHELDANNEEFEKLSKPLDTLSLYATFIVGLVIINAVVIISLVTALTLKTREYEIGVLLSIGATKLKIICQFFLELAIIAVIGFTMAVISGSLIAKEVGASVLEYQIASSGIEEEETNSYSYSSVWDDNYTTDISLDDLLSEYEVTVSPAIIAEIYVMGLVIVLIAVVVPSFMIMRYNPKKILMSQG